MSKEHIEIDTGAVWYSRDVRFNNTKLKFISSRVIRSMGPLDMHNVPYIYEQC